jgi:hypothetical protein
MERQTIQWPKDTKEVIRLNDTIWLPLWYLLIIVLSVVPSDYLFGIFWSLYYLSFHLITSFVSFGHCIVCHSIWLPLWYLLVIVLSTDNTMTKRYQRGNQMERQIIQWSKDTKEVIWFLITSLVSFGHSIVCRSIYDLWLPLWYLLVIVLSVVPFMISDYLFGIFWDNTMIKRYQRGNQMERQTIQGPKDTKEVIRNHKWNDRQLLSVVPFMISDYLFGIFWSLYCLSFHLWFLITCLVSFGHSIVCRSIWLPLWYLYNDQKIPKR